MRRSLAVLASSTLAVLVTTIGACTSTDDGPPARDDGGAPVDASFVVDDGAAPDVPEDPPPGDVCGDSRGLDPLASWPLRGGCPTRAGRSSSLGPQNANARWREPTSAGESSPAVAASNLIWLGTAEGDVLALTPGGTVRYAYRTGGPVRSSPAIDAHGNVVVGSSDGTLYAFAERVLGGDGDAGADAGPYPEPTVVFSIPVGSMASSPVIGNDGTIYVSTTNGELLAVEGDGSATKWSVTTNDTKGSSPAIGQNGTVYVGSSDHALYAIATDGTKQWSLDLGAEIQASPAVGGDGTVYVGTMDGKLHAVDPLGERRWSYATGGAIRSAPAVYAGLVYVGSDDQKLHAVSTLDGSLRWTYETLGAVATPVLGPDGVVYFGAADAHLYAVTSKGSLLFAVNLKGRVASAPAIGRGSMLYVTTDTGVVAVGP